MEPIDVNPRDAGWAGHLRFDADGLALTRNAKGGPAYLIEECSNGLFLSRAIRVEKKLISALTVPQLQGTIKRLQDELTSRKKTDA